MADTPQSLLDQLKDDSIFNNVDDIIADLKSDGTPEPTQPPSPPPNEEDLGKFIIDQSTKVIKETTALITSLKKNVAASGDAEEVAALADVITAHSSAVETLNKIYTQNKKIQAAKELKQQEIDGKKEVAKIKAGGDKPSGLVVANREEIFALLLSGKKKDIIDVDEFEPSDVEKTMEIEDKDPLGPS